MDSDVDLYHRWHRAGDEAAFAALARRHATLVADVAYRIGGDRGLAEDALQDSLLALARERTDRPAQVGVRAWLARAAILKARNAHASRMARARREQAVSKARPEAKLETPDSEIQAAVWVALGRLNGEDATLLTLRFVHAIPYREMAAILDIAEPTARVRVHRALERARRMSAVREVDQRAMGAALGAVPPFALSESTVEDAVTTAIRAAGDATQHGKVPDRSVPDLRGVLVVGAIGLVALLAVVAWRASLSGDRVRDQATQAEDRQRGPTLRGRSPGSPPLLADATTPDAPAPPEGQGKNPPKVGLSSGPSSAAARPPPPVLTPVAVRMELIALDGSTEEIEIETVHHKAYSYSGKGLREHPGLLRTRAGWRITVQTVDPRVATPTIIMRVPDPVPPVLIVTVPSKEDPRLGRLTLEVIDGPSGAPLPDAVLHRGQGESEHPILRADAQGRIVVPAPSAGGRSAHAQPALVRFASGEWMVHAPGHLGVGWAWGTQEFVPGVTAEDLATWLERGTKQIVLPPLPDVPGFEERAVRILDVEGRPVSGAYVHVAHPVKDKIISPLKPGLGVDNGFRRTDESGLLWIPMGDVVALAINVERVQVAAWGLSKDAWPGTGPRELRMPVLTSAEVVVTGLPDGPCGAWMRDPMGPWRSSGVGPLLQGSMDGAVVRFLEANEATFLMPDFARGHLSGPDAIIRISFAVGQTQVIHLHVGEERRLLEIRRTGGGPKTVRRRWESLPLKQ